MAEFGFMDWGLLLGLIIMLGGLAGFLAGLLGIGGGVVLVPGLYWIFAALGFEFDSLMHISIGTSLAIIIPTGLSSARAHWKRGGVRFDLVRRIGSGIVIGVLCGTLVAQFLSGDDLKIFFAFALIVFAGLMHLKPEKIHFRDDVPHQPWSGLAGVVIGTVSTLMGIGGATMNVPYMTFNNVPIHKAIGSASAMGPLIALPGAIGFVIIGWNSPNLIPFSFGYVNLVAAAIIIPVSVLVAPLGAKVAHNSSVTALRRIFSIAMILIAAKMLYGVFGG